MVEHTGLTEWGATRGTWPDRLKTEGTEEAAPTLNNRIPQVQRLFKVIGPTDGEVSDNVQRIKRKGSMGEHLTEREEDILEVAVRASRPMLLVDGTVEALPVHCAKTFPQWDSFVRRSAPMFGSVGRLDIPDGGGGLRAFATAFLLTGTLAATNRHVTDDLHHDVLAECEIIFGLDRLHSRSALPRRVVEVIATSDDFDLSVVRLDRAVRTFRPFSLSSFDAPVGRRVAVAGFPAADDEDEAAVDHLLDGVYDHLRLSPGTVIGHKNDATSHDCSTFGGSSGSPMLDLVTGRVIGVQFDGSYMVKNRAASRHAVTWLKQTAAKRGVTTP